jgi:hypothetical protein
VPSHWSRSRDVLSVSSGAVSLLIATAAVVLLLLSGSTPWLIGVQNEPKWSWAVGSGRLKVWLAEPGWFSENDRWTSSWYRGLDGQPIRWDFTLHRGSTGGVLVIAVPLWAIAGVGGVSGAFLLSLSRDRPTALANSRPNKCVQRSGRQVVD